MSEMLKVLVTNEGLHACRLGADPCSALEYRRFPQR